MPVVTLRSLELHYREEGTGPAILLGHSSTGSGGQWRALMGALGSRYRLVAPDHLGYGKSSQFDGMGPLMEAELELLEMLLRRVDEPVHLVGHSYGASLLVRIAVRNPEKIRSMTLIEPSLFYLLEGEKYRGEFTEIRTVIDRLIYNVASGASETAATEFIDYWLAPGAFYSMKPEMQRAIVATMAKLAVEAPNAFEPWGATPDVLRHIEVPTLLMMGSTTTTAAQGVTQMLRQCFNQHEFTKVSGPGHMGPLTHPEPYNERIEQFLSSLDGAACVG